MNTAPQVRRETLAELFAHGDWATDQILTLAEALGDAAIDRPFEMGPGSIRATLHHLWGAERLWLGRWRGEAEPAFPPFDPAMSIQRQRTAFRSVAEQRDALLAASTDRDLHAVVSYRNLRGDPFAQQLGHLMLHVANHGVHHRAQLVNMLRRVGSGLPRPGLDYIYYRLALGESAAAPRLQKRTVQEYFAYGDWATGRVLDAAATLNDAQLDRPFEMGLGSVRATLLHVRFAEQWWLQNWTEGPGRPFPESPPQTPLAQIRELCARTAAERNEFLAQAPESDLARIVTAVPRAGVERRFPLGCTMLQLCVHGTLHRAQVLNMLRALGVAPPPLDLALWLRERATEVRAGAGG